MRALVVGGTGPTGPDVVDGLIARGLRVTIFHRGTHEVDYAVPVEHIHGDPHFAESIAECLGDRTFDLVVATYGRLRLIADHMKGRCERFIGVGGVAIYPGHHDPQALWPHGLPPSTKELDLNRSREQPDANANAAAKFSYAVFQTETHVLELGAAGHFSASYFRYPVIYGPRQLGGKEWSIVRRVLDGRKRIVIADGGLAIVTRSYTRNAAHAVLLAVDEPSISAGNVYNVGDAQQFTVRQWAEIIASELGASIEFVSMPDEMAWPARAQFPLSRESAHSYLDTSKIVTELGYHDVVPAEEALRATAHWYVDNRDTAESLAGREDPFDYAGEDRLLRFYDRCLLECRAALTPELPTTRHPYPHPVSPGQARDHRGR